MDTLGSLDNSSFGCSGLSCHCSLSLGRTTLGSLGIRSFGSSGLGSLGSSSKLVDSLGNPKSEQAAEGLTHLPDPRKDPRRREQSAK